MGEWLHFESCGSFSSLLLSFSPNSLNKCPLSSPTIWLQKIVLQTQSGKKISLLWCLIMRPRCKLRHCDSHELMHHSSVLKTRKSGNNSLETLRLPLNLSPTYYWFLLLILRLQWANFIGITFELPFIIISQSMWTYWNIWNILINIFIY